MFPQPGSLEKFYDPGALTAAAATFDITGIPQGGYLLQVVIIGITTIADGQALVTLNGDAGANQYVYHSWKLDGTLTFNIADVSAGDTKVKGPLFPSSAEVTNAAGSLMLEIPMYASTLGNKSVFMKGAYRYQATVPFTEWVSGIWRSSAAVNRVTIASTLGSFDVGSRCVASILL